MSFNTDDTSEMDHDHHGAKLMRPPDILDYSLTGENASRSVEMVYIGGGAGMAPLRAHLADLFENEKTKRKVSYWYGARSKQEIYYDDYFEGLAAEHANFDFHLALSEPEDGDDWAGHTGFIHEVVLVEYLEKHPNPNGTWISRISRIFVGIIIASFVDFSPSLQRIFDKARDKARDKGGSKTGLNHVPFHPNPKSIEFYLCGPPMMITACTKMLEGLGVGPEQIAFDEF